MSVGSDGKEENDSGDVYTHFYEHSMLTFCRVTISDKLSLICSLKAFSFIFIINKCMWCFLYV